MNKNTFFKDHCNRLLDFLGVEGKPLEREYLLETLEVVYLRGANDALKGLIKDLKDEL